MVSVENSETSNLIRNIVLIGSTGAGKSTTGNYILTSSPQGPFQVSDEEISCTVFAEEQISKSKNIRVIDTPGFGDNRFSEKDIDKIIRELALILSDPRVDSTGQIDAFILPVKFNPRPAALKTDLEHFIDLFGKIALKSMILLLIFDKPRKTKADVLKAFNMMTEIVRIIKEGKDEEPNENWFCIWDNINPLPDQETELFEKISALEPYTHKKFVEADQEIKARLDAKVKAEVNRLITRAKRDYEDDKKAQEQKIKEIEERFQRERKELMEARERAQNDTKQFVEAMQRMGDQNKAEMEQLYLKMRTEREENQKKALATIQSMEERNNQQAQAILKQNDLMANLQKQIAEAANRQPLMQFVEAPSRKKRCNMF